MIQTFIVDEAGNETQKTFGENKFITCQREKWRISAVYNAFHAWAKVYDGSAKRSFEISVRVTSFFLYTNSWSNRGTTLRNAAQNDTCVPIKKVLDVHQWGVTS